MNRIVTAAPVVLAWAVALLGAVVLFAALDGKAQRFYPGDGSTGATTATEGAARYAAPAFLVALAALAALGWATAAIRTGAWRQGAVGAGLAAAGFGLAALMAHGRMAALAAEELASDRYDVVVPGGLGVAAWAAPAAAVGALVLALLLLLLARARPAGRKRAEVGAVARTDGAA